MISSQQKLHIKDILNKRISPLKKTHAAFCAASNSSEVMSSDTVLSGPSCWSSLRMLDGGRDQMSSRLRVRWKKCLETHITAPSSRGARKDPKKMVNWHRTEPFGTQTGRSRYTSNKQSYYGTGILKVHQCSSMSHIIHVRYHISLIILIILMVNVGK